VKNLEEVSILPLEWWTLQVCLIVLFCELLKNVFTCSLLPPPPSPRHRFRSGKRVPWLKIRTKHTGEPYRHPPNWRHLASSTHPPLVGWLFRGERGGDIHTRVLQFQRYRGNLDTRFTNK
jgi:hypothetical protein